MALGWPEDGSLPHNFVESEPQRSVHAKALPPSPHTSTYPAPIVTLDAAMRTHIENALSRTGGRIEGKQGAAALLKINPHTLRARMRKLKLDWTTFRREWLE